MNRIQTLLVGVILVVIIYFGVAGLSQASSSLQSSNQTQSTQAGTADYQALSERVSQIESQVFAVTITLNSHVDALHNDLLQAKADNETDSGNIDVLSNIALYGHDSNAKLREAITASQHQLTKVQQELAGARALAEVGLLVGLAGVTMGLLLSSR